MHGGSEKVISFLRKAIDGEAQASLQYLTDAAVLDNMGLPKLAKHVKGESDEERAHLARYLDRLTFLEVAPEPEAKPAVPTSTVKAIMEYQLELEMGAVKLYRDAVKTCIDEGDPVSRVIFEKTLEDEEGHVNYLETQLALIKAMGEPLYMAQFMEQD